MNQTIQFKYSENGKMELGKGLTVFGDVFALGAVNLTSPLKIAPGVCHYEYSTDTDGLEALINKSDNLLEHLNEAIEMLGLFVADIGTGENKDKLMQLVWLIIGLNELSGMVGHANIEMNDSLRKKKTR